MRLKLECSEVCLKNLHAMKTCHILLKFLLVKVIRGILTLSFFSSLLNIQQALLQAGQFRLEVPW